MAIAQNHLICIYNDCQVTLVNFSKPKRHIFNKINRLDPKLTTFDLCGSSVRRLEKKIHLNRTGDLVRTQIVLKKSKSGLLLLVIRIH